MLVIRKEQMAVLDAYMARRFRDAIRRHLRRELPDETQAISEEDLLRRIDQGLERGRRYGLTTERDLTAFVDLTFIHGPSFEELPAMRWAKRILTNKELEGDVKMNLIYQRLDAQQPPDELLETNV
jgi:hypothetical protein